MRVGPSRLISTAESSGESNDTVAAEWMTTSQEAKHGAMLLRTVRGRRVPTSPVIVVIRRAVISANDSGPSAQLGAEAVEGVVLQQLPLDPPGGGRALAVAHEQDQVAVGHTTQQPLDERRADEPGRAGDGDALAGQGRRDRRLRRSRDPVLPRRPRPLYQLVEGVLDTLG